MLSAKSRGIFSKRYELIDGGRDVGELRAAWFSDDAEASVDGVALHLYREGAFSGAFLLERDGVVVASARKPSAWRNRFEVEFGDVQCVLRKKRGFLRSRFAVMHEGSEIGELGQVGWFRCESRVDLPAEWPAALRVFLLWLAMIIWRREAANTVGG